MENDSGQLRRWKVTVFAVLVALFLLGVVVLKVWGPGLARAAYEPILLEKTGKLLRWGQYAEAEELLLRALKESPQYGAVVLDATEKKLGNMPKLAKELRLAFEAQPLSADVKQGYLARIVHAGQ